MTRREFIGYLAAIGATVICPPVRSHPSAAQAASKRASRFWVSSNGCGRATAYPNQNKIVTLGNSTHVTWLDVTPDGFWVRIRTLDRRTDQWSPVFTVGQARDNHGGPALAVDSQGYLHIAYGPHDSPICYRRSKRPNVASEWEEEIRFGQMCTYPVLVIGQDDTLYLTNRRDFPRWGPDPPPAVDLWTKRPGEPWQGPVAILRSRYDGYADFGQSMVWSPDHRTLHVCCLFHEKSDSQADGRLQTIGYMLTRDFGRFWQRSDGSPIVMPATAETIEVLASGGVDQKRVLDVGGIATDASGVPHIVYSVEEHNRGWLILAAPRSCGGWHYVMLNEFLPREWANWQVVYPAGVTFDRQNRIIVVATLQNVRSDERNPVTFRYWGHPSNEVVRFWASNMHSRFTFGFVSKPKPALSQWLPSVERPTGFNPIPINPGILYTAGPPGEKLSDVLANDVFWFAS